MRRKPLDVELVARFEVRRGSFLVPAELFEDGAEYELAVYFGQRLPSADDGVPLTTTRQRTKAGVVIHWRKVRVLISPA